jgi:hypothetical protein
LGGGDVNNPEIRWFLEVGKKMTDIAQDGEDGSSPSLRLHSANQVDENGYQLGVWWSKNLTGYRLKDRHVVQIAAHRPQYT